MNNHNVDFASVSKSLAFNEKEKEELYALIKEVLESDIWIEMMKIPHHLESRSIHSIEVCCLSWKRAKELKNCDEKAVAMGAILHDFFFYNWQTEKANIEELIINKSKFLPRAHGFVHPTVALDNAIKYFPHLVNEKVADIIVKHMWPLTVNPPRFKESWLVCYTDKGCSFRVIKTPKELPKYLGIKKFKLKTK